MISIHGRSGHTRTGFVQLSTHECKACWECLGSCPNQVLGKIDLPWHRHAIFVNPEQCRGCLKCVSVCANGALSKNGQEAGTHSTQHKKSLYRFLGNNLLLLAGIAMILSGMVLQAGFHMGGPPHPQQAGMAPGSANSLIEMRMNSSATIWGLTYPGWSSLHKIAIVLFSALISWHTILHWKWYKTVLTRRRISKNKEVLTLSLLFLLVAVTGLIPWFIDIAGGSGELRLGFIEIHDKLTLLLIGFLGWHLVKRIRWYSAAFGKLR